MKHLLLYEPESIINLDLKLLLKDYDVIPINTLFDLTEAIKLTKADLLLLHIPCALEECNIKLKFIKKTYDMPIIGLSTLSKEFIKPYKKYCTTIIELPYKRDELLSAINECLNKFHS